MIGLGVKSRKSLHSFANSYVDHTRRGKTEEILRKKPTPLSLLTTCTHTHRKQSPYSYVGVGCLLGRSYANIPSAFYILVSMHSPSLPPSLFLSFLPHLAFAFDDVIHLSFSGIVPNISYLLLNVKQLC